MHILSPEKHVWVNCDWPRSDIIDIWSRLTQCVTYPASCRQMDIIEIQSTLVISTSLISNNRLPRSENLVPVLTWKCKNRYQNIVEKSNFSSFTTIFSTYLLSSGVKLHIHLLNVVVRFIVFLNSANLICRGSDISKYSRKSLGLRDNESRLYQDGPEMPQSRKKAPPKGTE